MPCDSSQGMADAYRTDPVAQRRIAELKTECDQVTRMLCSLLRSLDDAVTLPPDVAAWYHKHREHDRAQGRT